MNQKLILVSGSPCVGKTTITDKLYVMLDNSAYCDGDWLWTVNPFSIEDPRLRDGDKNMSFVLSTYLKSQFEYVFFSSVLLTSKEIRSNIISDITYEKYSIISFTLTCSKDALQQRHIKRGETGEINYHWLDFEPLPNDILIDTTGKTVDEICEEMYGYLVK